MILTIFCNIMKLDMSITVNKIIEPQFVSFNHVRPFIKIAYELLQLSYIFRFFLQTFSEFFPSSFRYNKTKMRQYFNFHFKKREHVNKCYRHM